jgi:protein TonB
LEPLFSYAGKAVYGTLILNQSICKMNHVSIFEKSWLELVFEGRNKQYGAYRLRLENPRTTLIALLAALALTSVALVPLLLHKAAETSQGQIVVFSPTLLPQLPPELPQQPKTTLPATQNKTSDTNKKQLKDPLVVRSDQATDAMLTKDPVGKPNSDGNTGAPNAIDGAATGTMTASAGSAKGTPDVDTPTTVGLLDRVPQFPGGIENFYKYVGRNFRQPEISDEMQVRVIVSFVIEKDGSLTDIRVVRDPGYGLAQEAIRVLRSLKTKWQPGYIKGEPVRTAYTLPIVVQMK